MLTLTLAAAGCPKSQSYVPDLATASLLWRLYRDTHGFGASQMLAHCGEVRDRGKLVARVSYNGRVWSTDGKTVLQEAA